MRVIAILIVLLLTSCKDHRSSYDADSIAGRWRTDPFMSQFGRSVTEYCFDHDGHFEALFTSEGPKASERGTYRIERDQLVITGKTGTFSYAIVTLSESTVTLASDDEKRTYHRVERECRARAAAK